MPVPPKGLLPVGVDGELGEDVLLLFGELASHLLLEGGVLLLLGEVLATEGEGLGAPHPDFVLLLLVDHLRDLVSDERGACALLQGIKPLIMILGMPVDALVLESPLLAERKVRAHVVHRDLRVLPQLLALGLLLSVADSHQIKLSIPALDTIWILTCKICI